ncbi:thioesterase II family protein [Paenibacillus chitinolyticus]|uniref:thioesterase II family protein n=1 Tax=Paenibacillus chitinolyticus TaxID=79263 RepID=UPI0036591CE8
MKKIFLFCLPYAGGSSVIYTRWKPLLDSGIELVPLELAGRGRRINESFYESVDEAVNDLLPVVEPYLDKGQAAFFGYSMGSLIAFELIHRIREKHGHNPLHFFAAARMAPHIQRTEPPLHGMEPELFKTKIADLGGTPPQLFENSELMNLFLPLLRADFRLVETYAYAEKAEKLDCAMTVFAGKRDKMRETDVLEWKRHTTGAFTAHSFDGGHFFINDFQKEIVDILHASLGIRYSSLYA